MYAELRVILKNGVKSEILIDATTKSFGKSAIPVEQALADKTIAGFSASSVGAAAFPSGDVVVYLHILDNEVSVFVFGTKIRRLKDQCSKAVTLLRAVKGVSISSASASILIPDGATELDILTGEEGTFFGAFLRALIDKSLSKGFAAVTAALVTYCVFSQPAVINAFVAHIPSGAAGAGASPASAGAALAMPIVSSIISLIGVAFGVLAEALQTAWGSESWNWKESK